MARAVPSNAKLSAAASLQVPLSDASPSTPARGLALTFDDAFVEEWFSARPLFKRYGARATFYVCYPLRLSMRQLSMLQMLGMEGHEIAYHSLEHRNAVTTAEEIGIAGYVNEEIIPGLAGMHAFGLGSSSFAYPFGARTPELDREMWRHFRILRGGCKSAAEAVHPFRGNRLVLAAGCDLFAAGGDVLRAPEAVVGYLDGPRSRGGVLALYAHGISDTPVDHNYVSFAGLEALLAAASASEFQFVTVSEMV
jgi:peptidoglycan/xylan/chitin deacetylase (PgdA/CDA1 family)